MRLRSIRIPRFRDIVPEVFSIAWMWALKDNGGPWFLVILGHFALSAYCALYTALFGWLLASASVGARTARPHQSTRRERRARLLAYLSALISRGVREVRRARLPFRPLSNRPAKRMVWPLCFGGLCVFFLRPLPSPLATQSTQSLRKRPELQNSETPRSESNSSRGGEKAGVLVLWALCSLC